ncbi:MAG: stage II sporulation protein M [Bacteroidota bacterium]|jgi:uncharacterized membrane protein SpoIIM required for sporulation
MREAAFTKQNHQKWKAFEDQMAQTANTHPDKLAELFIEITDDLSYAQTYYPQSKTTQYLNGLAIKAHQTIYRNKKEKQGRLFNFWAYEVPLAIQHARIPMRVSLIVFVLAILAGIVSTYFDKDFPRFFLGNEYVNTTLNNISEGNPMGIYGDSGSTDMFFRITFNNIMVSLRVIALGILASVFTCIGLLQNGVMVGVFFTFLFNEGVLGTAMMTVWIHGVIEISSIVIAGGAGILLGNSILFPGTYTRMQSLKNNARIVIKIAVGLVPLFIIAGFLESFVTRYYQEPIVGILSIGITLPFIVWYYIILPKKLYKKLYAQQG